MPENDQSTAPPTGAELVASAQLSDAAVADLQLVLDGVRLPWIELGADAAQQSVHGAQQSVHGTGQSVPTVQSVPGIVTAAGPVVAIASTPGLTGAARVELVDREATPLALLEVDASSSTADRLVGTLRPRRARESRLFLDQAWTPQEAGPADGARHVVVADRPVLTADLAALANREGEVLVLVPVESASADGVPAVTMMRCTNAAVAGLENVKVVAVPVFLRGTAAADALVGALASAYDATTSHRLGAGPSTDWDLLLGALQDGSPLPEVAPDAVLDELLRWRPPPSRRGLLVLFTGLSGSGKSTLARDLVAHVLEHTARTVTLLDGDDVRRLLSAGLGFDRASRELNVRRIAYVGSEIARHGGLAVCAPIAPYAAGRAEMRAMVAPFGDFVMVHVSTPLEECERRDLKGWYAKARAGLISEFTGISDPYDVPLDADLAVDTSVLSRQESLDRVLRLLHSGGWLGTEGPQ